MTDIAQAPKSKLYRRPHRAVKPQLLTRSHLDGRSNAAREYDRIVSGIESDLGGKDRLSTVQSALIEAFAGVAVQCANLNTRVLLGEQIDLSAHSAAVGAMVRVASRIGVVRVPRDVTGLNEYLAAQQRAQQREAQHDEADE
jgi:hypothetical protein